jgi:hypothetical protein
VKNVVLETLTHQNCPGPTFWLWLWPMVSDQLALIGKPELFVMQLFQK